MNTIILYRDMGDWKYERKSAEKHFPCISSRTQIKENDLVICRYSSLPYFNELEEDIKFCGGKLLNSYNQHKYVADISNWYYDLKEYTPRTWFDLSLLPEDKRFVLKGETNSKKNYWKTHMFANNKKEAIEVQGRLFSDGLIGDQAVCAREFVELETYFISPVTGQPITKEFRFFVLGKEILCGAFYWSIYSMELDFIPSADEVPRKFLEKIINIVSDNINFYVIDVGKTVSGDWVLIELNDGTMSGISDNDPRELYLNLKNNIGPYVY